MNLAQLAQDLKVSNTPIREATARLEPLGLVEMVPYCGPKIKRLNAAQLKDIYDVRIALEGLAARLVARYGHHEVGLHRLEIVMSVRNEASRRVAERLGAHYEGVQRGVVSTDEARALARDLGLDLVEISPTERPPVCRIMDYGKHKYDQNKKRKQRTSHVASLKEVRLRPKTDKGDLDTKTTRAREFLEEGDKVQFTVIFRGRELARQDLGTDLLRRVAEMLEDIAKIEKAPSMEGRRMHMTLVKK